MRAQHEAEIARIRAHHQQTSRLAGRGRGRERRRRVGEEKKSEREGVAGKARGPGCVGPVARRLRPSAKPTRSVTSRAPW